MKSLVKSYCQFVNENLSADDLSFEEIVDLYNSGIVGVEAIKKEVANKLLAELERRKMGHTLLSSNKQLKEGKIVFEFSGEKAKPIIDLTFSNYGFDKKFLIPNLKGENFWDKVNTGTPYTLAGEGFMKHNTGPSKINFEVSEDGIVNIVDHVIDNAQRYLMHYTLNSGFTSILTDKVALPETEVNVDKLAGYVKQCNVFENEAIESNLAMIYTLHRTRPVWYKILAPDLQRFYRLTLALNKFLYAVNVYDSVYFMSSDSKGRWTYGSEAIRLAVTYTGSISKKQKTFKTSFTHDLSYDIVSVVDKLGKRKYDEIMYLDIF